jgi:hypothetical protein
MSIVQKSRRPSPYETGMHLWRVLRTPVVNEAGLYNDFLIGYRIPGHYYAHTAPIESFDRDSAIVRDRNGLAHQLIGTPRYTFEASFRLYSTCQFHLKTRPNI